MEAAQRMPGWLAELNKFEEDRAAHVQHSHQQAHDHHDHEHGHGHGHSHKPHSHKSEADKYGISSFVYFASRPFHPGRLMEHALSVSWAGVLRSKGFFWLATRHDVMGIWQSAGAAWQGEPSALWLAALPASERPPDVDTATWHPVWGDRCQQLVWIGIDMDEAAIRSMLDGCLLTEAEMALGPEGWAALEDPLPPWVVEEGEEGEDGEEEGEGQEADR